MAKKKSHTRKITDVRQAIYRELCYAPAFTNELSQLLRVNRRTVAWHLNQMLNSGEIVNKTFYEPSHIGRPVKLYMIPAHAPKGRD